MEKQDVEHEYEILKKIQNKDYVVQVLNCFYFTTTITTTKNHFVVVLESLHQSLYQIRKISLEKIRVVGKQLLLALDFLHRNQIIHADLKPENIMFTPENQLRLIDFGCSQILTEDEKEIHPCIVASRPYRPPEVVIGLPFNQKIDIWAVGCILYECYVGHFLFQPKNEAEHLAQMEHILNKYFPKDMAKAACTLDYTRNTHQASFLHTRSFFFSFFLFCFCFFIYLFLAIIGLFCYLMPPMNYWE